MPKIEIECQAGCRGTGLYEGFAEPKETAVICHGCQGTGKQVFAYTEFTGRKPRKGIKIVRESRGTLIVTGVGPVGHKISYSDFQKGKMP